MRLLESENSSDAIVSSPTGASKAFEGTPAAIGSSGGNDLHGPRGPGQTSVIQDGESESSPVGASGWRPGAQRAANEVVMPDFRGDDLVAFVCAIAGAECSLTPMELEVARMRLLGWQRQAIATHMGRSTHTIDSHLKAVRRKLGSGSATALFKAAVETLNRRSQASARELD